MRQMSAEKQYRKIADLVRAAIEQAALEFGAEATATMVSAMAAEMVPREVWTRRVLPVVFRIAGQVQKTGSLAAVTKRRPTRKKLQKRKK